MASQASAALHFDLDMSPAANNVINNVARRRNIDPAQVLARAIALVKFEEDAREAGQSLGLIDKDKRLIGELS